MRQFEFYAAIAGILKKKNVGDGDKTFINMCGDSVRTVV